MSNKLTKFYGRVALLSGSSSEWSSANPVLMNGEVGIEVIDSDNHYNFKVGDGRTRFSELPTIFNNLPKATNYKLGGVIIGSGINVSSSGVISVSDFLPLTGGNINGNLTVSGDIRGARVFNPYFNDYAEYFLKSPSCPSVYEEGDLVILDKNYDYECYTIVTSNRSKSLADRDVFIGVVSESFGQILGGEGLDTDSDNYLPVALVGRVYVKVPEGLSISRGDELVYSVTEGSVKVRSLIREDSNCKVIGTVVDIPMKDDSGKVRVLIR